MIISTVPLLHRAKMAPSVPSARNAGAPWTPSRPSSSSSFATNPRFSYNIAAIFFAGFTPALMTWAITYTPLSTGIYVALSGIVALVTLPVMLRLIALNPDGAAFLGEDATGVAHRPGG